MIDELDERDMEVSQTRNHKSSQSEVHWMTFPQQKAARFNPRSLSIFNSNNKLTNPEYKNQIKCAILLQCHVISIKWITKFHQFINHQYASN